MDVSDVLRRAWAAVQEAELPSGVQEVGFREAVRLLAPPDSGARTRSPGADPVSPEASPDSAAQDPVMSEAEIFRKVAAQTGVDAGALERIVYLDGETLRVAVPGLKLGKNNSERARAVAQLLVVVRGFGLGESDTSLEIVREECDRLRVYDQNNFSHHMKGIDGYVVTGSGVNRRMRVKGPGIEAFGGLVERLAEA